MIWNTKTADVALCSAAVVFGITGAQTLIFLP